MRNYKLIGIAAVADNGVIGSGNKLPWHIPEDLAFFKKTTLGHTIVMGRPTARSIGRPLPGRRTLILTRKPSEAGEISELDAIQSETGMVFLCGGSDIYAAYLFECDELFITHVKREVYGDKYFPYFLHKFDAEEVLCDNLDFKIIRYKRKSDEN